LGQTARAQEVGTVAAVDGTAEIGRSGVWTAAAIGTAVQQRDELRTGQPGRLRVVFQDDSTLALSDSSHVIVDENVFNPNTGKTHSLMDLVRGKVEAVVSEYYHQAGANYEIKTQTAVAGVRGTEFSMYYDPQAEFTEVVGISGVVSVHSTADPTDPGVLLTANEATTVSRGERPRSPQRLEDTLFRQRLEGIEFIGGGRPESLSAHALVSSNAVPSADRAGTVTAPSAGVAAADQSLAHRDVSNLVGKSPVAVLAETGQLGFNFGHK
jgi:hypothetical protein